MVLEIVGEIAFGVLVGIFVLSAISVVMEEIVIPVSDKIETKSKKIRKHCIVWWHWLKNLRWYYKWMFFIAFVVLCLICEWINGLLVAWLVFAYCFAKWLIGLSNKICVKFEKRKIKHDNGN